VANLCPIVPSARHFATALPIPAPIAAISCDLDYTVPYLLRGYAMAIKQGLFFSRAAIALVLAGVAGCQQYEVNLNGRTLYRPAPLFSDFVLADKALSACVKQTILDRAITRQEDLVSLKCTYASIESLEGLERFTQLQVLDLRHNRIGRWVSQPWALLQRLDLRGNPVNCQDLVGRASAQLTVLSDCPP
jgi:hypothetical protein